MGRRKRTLRKLKMAAYARLPTNGLGGPPSKGSFLTHFLTH